MRKIKKISCPQILTQNQTVWTQEYIEDPQNETKKFRYRHKEIKNSLLEETSVKCVYCESKVGHNTPGDVEHIIPSSHDKKLHFEWVNLTIACTECNRRKGSYYDPKFSFLNPYFDNVESLVIHHGPIVGWKVGNKRAEFTVKKLELHNEIRSHLIFKKIEKVRDIMNTYTRFKKEKNLVMKTLLGKEITEMQKPTKEFSGMVKSIVQQLSA